MSKRSAHLLGSVLLALVLLWGTAEQARAALPLCPRGLAEKRRTVDVRPGLKWTRIVRGRPSRRNTGPWVVNVLVVERSRLSGRVSALLARGQVAGLERTTAIARRTRSLGRSQRAASTSGLGRLRATPSGCSRAA